MSDLDHSSGSRTQESPDPTVDAEKSTELGPASEPGPTSPPYRKRDLTAEAAAMLRYLPLDPAGLPGSLGRLAHYEILGLVGRGAMGYVVRAYDTQLTRFVAIKLMTPHLTSSESAVARFNREARAAAGINHPNVVIIHAVSEHRGIPFLVMEYVDGISLMDRIRSGPTPSMIEILRIAAQIAAGLAAAHRHGVIHRDIKPANIMLEGGMGRVKITDFGLARVLEDQSDLTSQGAAVGTPAYMSPEQVNGLPLDARSDLFSLGGVMYAMAAGQSPFRGENARATARRITSQEHVSLAKIGRDVPDFYVRVVDRLLAKEPRNRYRSADELVGEMTDYLAKVSRSPDHSGERLPHSTENAWWPRLAWMAFLLMMAVVALLVAGRRDRADEVASAPPSPPVPGPPVAVAPVLPRIERPVPPASVTVAKQGPAQFRTIAEALARAVPNQKIRVIDSATYDEHLVIADPERLAGVRLEASSAAVIRSPGKKPLVRIRAVPGFVIAGFFIEAEKDQHAIDIRGECPGTAIEDCDLVGQSDSDYAVVYLHGGASGTRQDPIRLSNLRVRCGGVGVVVGEFSEAYTVGWVEVSENRIRAMSRDRGVPVAVQGLVRNVAITRNLLATAYAAVSFRFPSPESASEVVVESNSIGDALAPFLIADPSSPKQGIRIVDNLIVDAAMIIGDGPFGPYAGWFSRNLWQRGPGFDLELATIFPEHPAMKFRSSDPSSDDFLRPAEGEPTPRAGRHRGPK